MSRKARRLLLIEPPFYRLYRPTFSLTKLPHGLAYLAGVIRAERPEWQVAVYNADFSPADHVIDTRFLSGPGFRRYLNAIKDRKSPIWEKIRATVTEWRPTVVGISAKSQNFAAACIVADIVKSCDRDIPVVVGGPHPSIARAEVLEHAAIDIAAFGEGEDTVLDIVDWADGRQSLSRINGIIYREGGEVIENPPRDLIDDLDALPFPVAVAPDTLIDYRKYPRQAFKYVLAIRGCPYYCAFCGSKYVWSRRVRFRSPTNVTAEIREIRKTGVNYVHFDDDTFGIKKSFIEDLCGAIRKDCPGLHWSCEIHAKLVTDQTMAAMKAAGCRLIQLGVESGNNQVLQRLRKDVTVEEVLAAAEIIKRHKLYLQANFMVGVPYETESSLNDTIAAIHRFPADSIIYSIFTPYPGTELFDYCTQHGIIQHGFDVALYNHQSPENYFCPGIPRDVFSARLRQLERSVDKINGRRKLRMHLSYEGHLQLRERGLRRTFSQFCHFCMNALNLPCTI